MSSSMPEKSTGKSKAAKPIPQGYHTLTPYLLVDNAQQVIDFMKKAFDAKETVRITAPDNKVGHVELKIGDSMIMISDTMKGTPAMKSSLYIYVDDADKTFQRAVQAGGQSIKEPEDQFYGDRAGCVRDPAGNSWWISTHIEDVSEDELKRRTAQTQHKMEKPQ